MAIPILEALARGDDLLDPPFRIGWPSSGSIGPGSPKDIGVTIGSVLGCAGDPVRAVDLSAAARCDVRRRAPRRRQRLAHANNADRAWFPGRPAGFDRGGGRLQRHHPRDPVAAEACVLWNHAQRHAVVHAEFDMTVGLSHLPSERREVWRDHIRVAESGVPRDFRPTTAGGGRLAGNLVRDPWRR